MTDWDRIVDRHGPAVWRAAWRLLGSADEAQDCLQDTFLKALEFSRRQRVRNWPALLHRMATRQALTRLRERIRRRKRHADMPSMDALPAGHAGPLEAMQAEELAEWLRVALATLPTRQAEVFTLHFVEQMSHEQIAEALDLRNGTVRVTLHAARKRLRNLLAEAGRGGDAG